MWAIVGILSVLEFVAGVVLAVYEVLIRVRPGSKDVIDRWTARHPAKGLWKALWWWYDYGRVVRRPDGTIGLVNDYSLTRLGRDLRRAGSSLGSLVRRRR